MSLRIDTQGLSGDGALLTLTREKLSSRDYDYIARIKYDQGDFEGSQLYRRVASKVRSANIISPTMGQRVTQEVSEMFGEEALKILAKESLQKSRTQEGDNKSAKKVTTLLAKLNG